MADLVLLTGISGFLGGHVALELLKQGHRVRGSVRDLKRAEKVKATLSRAGADVSQLEFVALDLTSDAGWDEAMVGVRYLQHTASPFITTLPKDRDELIGPAVAGTRRAIEAALRASVEHVVLTSSMAAIMYGHDRARTTPFTGVDWTNLDGREISAYVESKTRAETLAWELMDKAGRHRDLSTINPGAIFGPLLDEDPGTSVALLKRIFDGSLPAAARISFIVIDVRDVAAAHVAAMTSPLAKGERFPMGNGSYTLMQIANILRPALPERAGKMPRFEVPDWVVRAMGFVDKDVRANLGELGTNKTADAKAVIALLGRPLIAADEAMVSAAKSLIAAGLA
ncbi:MAG: NAD-dependent epimerase/dehydratase family protein [Devosia sp.]